MLGASGVGWPDVMIALIAALPGIIAAWASLRTNREIRTPSGDSIGKVTERTHDTAIANNLHLRKANGGKLPGDPMQPGDEPEAA